MVSSKLAAIVVASASALGVTATKVPPSLTATNEIVTYLFTVGLSTLLLSLIGALLGSLIAEPLKPRSKMWAIFLASVITGAMASSILPKMPGLDWVGDIPSQVLGFFSGLLGRWFIPAVIDAIPDIVKGVKDRVIALIGRAK